MNVCDFGDSKNSETLITANFYKILYSKYNIAQNMTSNHINNANMIQ